MRLAIVLLAGGLLLRSADPRGPADGDEAPPLPARHSPLGLPELPPAPPDEERLAALGRRLFFDPLLSSDRTRSCASCHDPAHGFADAEPLSEGVQGRRTTRNTPSVINRSLGRSFFWDGRAATLEEQVLMPIENPLEMDLDLDALLERLSAAPDYADDFPGGPTRAGLAKALAAYVRRLTLGDSPVDRFRAGAVDALTDAERAGLWFYESRGGCWRCHGGPNFTDEAFHNTGVGAVDGVPEEGRAGVTGLEADRGAFKTPTLRGVGRTAPYMHDGSLADLAGVVAFYRGGGRPNTHLDERLAPIEMSDEDAANLVAFLEALSRAGEELPGIDRQRR
jgi:cytochrome c peroxidase